MIRVLPAIVGIETVIKNMRAANKNMGARFSRNIFMAGKFLQRESMKIVPVEDGDLRGSAYTRPIGRGWDRDVIVGYNNPYAIWVHEIINSGLDYTNAEQSTYYAHGAMFNVKHADKIAKGWKHYAPGRGANQQAKFLEKPMREKRFTMLRIIAGKL